MKEIIFKGCGTAICTPFTEDNKVNYKELKEFIEFQIRNKIDALIVCGTTGEAATMSEEERNMILVQLPCSCSDDINIFEKTFIVLGIAFFILEIFFLPGVSIGGIVGTLFTGAGIWYAFVKLGATAGWIVVAVSAIALLLAIVYFIKGQPLDKMALDKELEQSNPYDMTKVAIGDTGYRVLRLWVKFW